jgi:putative oxidoreductase
MNTIALRSSSRARTALLWTLQIGSAAMFFLAGFSKLAGAAPMVQLFATLGLGQWFRYLTGAIEVASAVMLLVPSLAIFGGALLIPTMAGAIVTHLFVIGGSPAIPVILLAASAAIVFLKWSENR